MTSKIKTITLVTWEGLPDSTAGVNPPYVMERKWKVTKVTDSIEFSPGQRLTREQVQELVDVKSWKVTVLDKQS